MKIKDIKDRLNKYCDLDEATIIMIGEDESESPKPIEFEFEIVNDKIREDGRIELLIESRN